MKGMQKRTARNLKIDIKKFLIFLLSHVALCIADSPFLKLSR